MQVEYDFEQQKEIAVEAYSRSYDLDIAFTTAEFTSEERAMLQRDTTFMSRINYIDAKLKEEMIETMLSNMREGKPELAQKAANDLGKIIWPEKFSGKVPEPKGQVPDSIVLKGE